MKRYFKFLLTSILVILLSACNLVNPTSSNTSSSSSSVTTSSSNSSNSLITYGSKPTNVKIYTEDEVLTYMKSSAWQEFEELYVSGIVSNVSFNSRYSSYTVDLENGFEIYSGVLGNNVIAPEVGDFIIASGRSKIYTNNSGTKIYEIAYDSSHNQSPTIHYLETKSSTNTDKPIIPDEFEDYGFPIITVDIDDYNVNKEGLYTSKEEVAIYIYLYQKLPSNYKKKSQFNKSDYTSTNKLSTGGDTFYNKEGLLPKASSRTYIEADIDYRGGGRGTKRIVYSSDFLIFYTSDHYASFSIMRVIN